VIIGNNAALGTGLVTLAGGTLQDDGRAAYTVANNMLLAAAPFAPTAPTAVGATGTFYNSTVNPTSATSANFNAAPLISNAFPVYTRVDAQINYPTNGNGWTFNAGTGNFAGFPVGVQLSDVVATWTGSLNIVTGGTYTFTNTSDDGAQLFIDGTLVVTTAVTTVSGSIFLTPGLHSFQLVLDQITGGASMTCSYAGPDTAGATVLVPAAATPTSAGLLSGLPSTVNALNPALALTFSGNINGGGSLIKGGAGNLTLTNLDTNTGTVNVQGGNLTLTGNGTLAQVAGLIVSNNTTLTAAPATGILASPAGISAVQTLTFGAGITGGTFTLTFNGLTTTPIAWSNTIATLQGNIQAALDALPNVGPGNTLVSNAANPTITFQNGLARTNVPTMTFNAAALTGGTISSLVTTTTGVTAQTVVAGGTLTLDNTGTNNPNRINDTAAIALAGGTLNFLGANNLASTETLGNLTIYAGQATINPIATGSGSTTLTFGTYTRNIGGTVNFVAGTGGNQTLGSNDVITFSADPRSNGILRGGCRPVQCFCADQLHEHQPGDRRRGHGQRHLHGHHRPHRCGHGQRRPHPRRRRHGQRGQQRHHHHGHDRVRGQRQLGQHAVRRPDFRRRRRHLHHRQHGRQHGRGHRQQRHSGDRDRRRHRQRVWHARTKRGQPVRQHDVRDHLPLRHNCQLGDAGPRQRHRPQRRGGERPGRRAPDERGSHGRQRPQPQHRRRGPHRFRRQ
jgi:hypothetical protein